MVCSFPQRKFLDYRTWFIIMKIMKIIIYVGNGGNLNIDIIGEIK